MTSEAFDEWRSSRLVRLDRLLEAHPHSVGSPTDPAVAKEWTHALILRLASEFQGFCRDRYDDFVETILDVVTEASSPLRFMLLNGLIVGRGLDRRSADPKTIGDDFDRLGSNLWTSLELGWPGSSRGWREGLALLHRARNGVAHDDRRAIAAVEAAGWPLQIVTIEKWRNLLDEVAEAVEACVNRDIAELIGKNPKGGGKT